MLTVFYKIEKQQELQFLKFRVFFVISEFDQFLVKNIIIPLADDLYNNGYEILPVVKKLLESQHFFDAADSDPTDEIIGSIIKSPLQLLSSTITNLGFNIPDPENDMEITTNL